MSDRETQENLKMIRRLMEDSQRVIHDNGKHQITWGVLISAALVWTYGALALERPAEAIGWAWVVAIVAGWGLSIWFGRTEHREAPVGTLANRILGGIWIGFGITVTLLWLLSMFTGLIAPAALAPVMAALLGLGYFATSFACNTTWLRGAAFAWWVGTVVMAIWPGLYTLLLFAGMLVVLQVVPNLLFHGRNERELAGGAV